MRKIRKIAKWCLLTFLLILTALIITAEVSEDKITDIALQKVRKQIKIPLDIQDVSFSLLRRFPLATIEFKGMWMGVPTDHLLAIPPAENDTLIHIEKVYISVKSFPLLRGHFELSKVEVLGAHLAYIIDTKGKSNFDFLLSTPETETSDSSSILPNLILDELILEDISCHYRDSASELSAQVVLQDLQMQGQILNNQIKGFAEGALKVSNTHVKGFNLHLMEEANMTFEMDYANEDVTIHQAQFSTNGVNVNLKGWVGLKDTLRLNLHVTDSEFRPDQLTPYLPTQMLDSLGIQHVSARIKVNAALQGPITDSILPQLNSSFEISEGQFSMAGFPKLTNAHAKGLLWCTDILETTSYQLEIDPFHFETANSNGQVRLSVQNIDRPYYSVSGDVNAHLGEFSELIPESLGIHLDGRLITQFASTGVLPDSINMAYIDYLLANSRADMELSHIDVRPDSLTSVEALNGQIRIRPGSVEIQNTSAYLPDYNNNIRNATVKTKYRGNLSRPKDFLIEIPELLIQTDSSHLQAKLMLQNLKAPFFSFEGQTHLTLNELRGFLPDTLVSNIGGEIKGQVVSQGQLHLDSIADQAIPLLFENSFYDFHLQKVTASTPDTLIGISNLSGRFSMLNDTLNIHQLDGNYRGLSFETDTLQVIDAYQAILKKEKIPVQLLGDIHLGDFDYALVEPFMSDSVTMTAPDSTVTGDITEAQQEAQSPGFSFLAKGRFTMNSLTYHDAFIEDISMLFKLTDSLYVVDQLICKAFDGEMNSSVKVEMLPDNKKIIQFKNQTTGMNIENLLKDFNDFTEFGNTYITHEQLKGNISIQQIDGSFTFIGDSLDFNSIMVRSDSITLEDGRLTNYDMAVEMANLYNMDDLKDLQFQTISTKLFIYKNVMYFPATNVKNNALDVNVYGKQSFGDDCEYHVRLYTSELLNRGKNERIIRKKERKQEKEDGKTKGMMVLYAMYEIKDGETKMKPEGKESPERRQLRAQLFVQESGLSGVFDPRSISYKTGITTK
jgi:hypothetical protein